MRTAVGPRSLALALGAAALLAGCGPTGQPASPGASVTSSAPASGASAAPTASPTPPVQGEQLPEVGCCFGTELEPGRYASPRFIPFWVSLELGPGWRGVRNGTDRIFAFVRGRNSIGHSTHYLMLIGADATSREAFLDSLAETPRLRISAPRPLTLGALQGVALDAEALRNPEVEGTDERIAGAVLIPGIAALTNPFLSWFTESPRALLRVYVLEATDAHELLVYVEAPRDEFASFTAEVEQVLATLQVAAR
jgi:hypothetical protein